MRRTAGTLLAATARLGDRRLLGPARRPAGGVGQESASPEPQETTATGRSDA
jgi:hypothetical protein